MHSRIEFETMAQPDAAELRKFYERQNHETTHSLGKLQRMIDDTYCCVTARCDGELIGFARGVSDGLWGRLAECKLDPKHQGPACVTRTDGRIEHDSEGIAREMARRVIAAMRDHGVERVDALAYGTEVDFCSELGFRKMGGVDAMELTGDALDKVAVVAHAHATT